MCGESWLSVQVVNVLALHFQIVLTLADRHRGTGAAALWQGAALRRACGRAAAAPPGQHRPGAAEAGGADPIDEHLMEDVINGAAPMDGAAPPRAPMIH